MQYAELPDAGTMTFLVLSIFWTLYFGRMALQHQKFKSGVYQDFATRMVISRNLPPEDRGWWIQDLIAFAIATVLLIIAKLTPGSNLVNYVAYTVFGIAIVAALVSIPKQIQDHQDWYDGLHENDRVVYDEYRRRSKTIYFSIFFCLLTLIGAMQFLP